MSTDEFPTWFQHQAAIQNEVQHILVPEWEIHDTQAAIAGAEHYRSMAHESRAEHNKDSPNQLFNQALIAITGFAVTGNQDTTLQVAQENNILELTPNPGTTAIIGMLVPELKNEAATMLKKSPQWRRLLKAADNPYRTTSELLQLCKDQSSKEDFRLLDSAVRWAVAAVHIRREATVTTVAANEYEPPHLLHQHR